jgi:glycolate oxidase FAD binding subunit
LHGDASELAAARDVNVADVHGALARLLGTDAVRTSELEALHAIPVACPTSEEQFVETLRMAARERLALVPLGFGSKLGWCRPPSHVDFAVSTRGLAGVVAYEPADGTLTARAGTSMAELEAVAHAGGSHLTPLVPQSGHATLGGVLAAGQSGLDRTRHGPVRNHVLGMRVALADGTIVKSGGRLVKNVTGYDMHRLYCGSHGTLCVILEATLRIFPLPEREVVVRASDVPLSVALEAAESVSRSAVRLLALRLEANSDRADDTALNVVLAGANEVVDWELGVVRSFLPNSTPLHDENAARAITQLRECELESSAWPHLRVSMRPSALPTRLPALLQSVRSHDLSARVVVDPLVATIDVHLRPAHVDSEVLAALVRELRRGGLSVEMRRGAMAAMEALDPFGDSTPAIEWMRRLKDSLDPNGTFARGRFHGGL